MKPTPQINHDRRGLDPEAIRWGYASHLRYSLGQQRESASDQDRYQALALAVRDRIMDRWMKTKQVHDEQQAKRVYYLSLEFLIGRSMGTNVINLGLEPAVREALQELGYQWEDLRDQEIDAGLGNGGLGRLAACFMDSLATLDLPAVGYGIRYDYGIFRQALENGNQVEHPDDWLRNGNPWEVERPDLCTTVHFGGRVIPVEEHGGTYFRWIDTEEIIGMPHDMPAVGYGGHTINTLRLWAARASEEFDFSEFNEGDYADAVAEKVSAENLSKVLYPNDKLYLGRELRLRQQYFFVASSLQDIVRRFRATRRPWSEFPDLAAIQLNDTHPSLAVPELVRILVDEERVPWDEALDITTRTLAYTNHTLMPEALEKWPVEMLERLLPRHLQIIYALNHSFLKQVAIRFPGNVEKVQRMSIIEEGQYKQVRMAFLSIVGSHSTNGVAALHTKLLQERLVPDFAEMFPDRFNNKTNGITQRRFLLKANPGLAGLITETIGEGWITDFSKLSGLKKQAGNAAFGKALMEVKAENKRRFADYCHEQYNITLNPESIFDTQVKRIHEYKRQLLNILHVIILYVKIKNGTVDDMVPQTFLFAGKAAPGYRMAKLIIKLINNVAQVVNSDPSVMDQLAVHFLPNYRVSLAERIIPASDVSEQISTAGTEASGTGNMKFMCNGALTLGTLDGANIEIAEEAGHENVFIFGLTADEVEALRPTYSPQDYYRASPDIAEALNLLYSGHFNFGEPGIFEPIREVLFERGDNYMHLADLLPYAEAQHKLRMHYADQKAWATTAAINIASAGKFSTDRTIAEYAREVWKVLPIRPGDTDDGDAVLDEARSPAAGDK